MEEVSSIDCTTSSTFCPLILRGTIFLTIYLATRGQTTTGAVTKKPAPTKTASPTPAGSRNPSPHERPGPPAKNQPDAGDQGPDHKHPGRFTLNRINTCLIGPPDTTDRRQSSRSHTSILLRSRVARPNAGRSIISFTSRSTSHCAEAYRPVPRWSSSALQKKEGRSCYSFMALKKPAKGGINSNTKTRIGITRTGPESERSGRPRTIVARKVVDEKNWHT